MISAWTYTISFNGGSWKVNRSKGTVMPSGQPGLMGLPLQPPATVGLLAGMMLPYDRMLLDPQRISPVWSLVYPYVWKLPIVFPGEPGAGGATPAAVSSASVTLQKSNSKLAGSRLKRVLNTSLGTGRAPRHPSLPQVTGQSLPASSGAPAPRELL